MTEVYYDSKEETIKEYPHRSMNDENDENESNDRERKNKLLKDALIAIKEQLY